MPRNDAVIALIGRRHPEWREHNLRWRWLLDSLEGGERYRNAVYGYDRRGLPARNLVRHKREYPDPREEVLLATVGGDGPAPPTTDDDYELRRARTPVPTFVAEAVQTHLARIFSREVTRRGPDDLVAWWADVDGSGTTIDHWMSETVAPILLTLGQVDLCMDHPPAPEGEVVETRADLARLGLDRCVATCILPENMLWWRLDEAGTRYVECLVLEYHETDDGAERLYRHWTDEGSTLYDERGETIASYEHGFGRVPIVRVFDARKPRCRNVGQSRYEGIAERQREYYNRDSELILSDTTQAHPLLQGPEDFVQPDGTIPIGPSWLLPKKKNTSGSSTSYEGFEVVDFPKDGAESIRRRTKPTSGTTWTATRPWSGPPGATGHAAVGPREKARPLRRQQPARQGRQDPEARRGGRRGSGLARPPRRPGRGGARLPRSGTRLISTSSPPATWPRARPSSRGSRRAPARSRGPRA